jgi:hypothetical protein
MRWHYATKLAAPAWHTSKPDEPCDLLKTNDTVRPELERFVISEAWVAQGSGLSDGVFARVNTSRFAMIADIDDGDAGVSALFDPSGIIVAGDRYTVHENGHTAKGRTATQVYQRIANAPAAATAP